jgi:hypothetical protein
LTIPASALRDDLRVTTGEVEENRVRLYCYSGVMRLVRSRRGTDPITP